MIKKNKKQLIISSIVILLPIIVGLLLWNVLPERITTHWNGTGEADGWSSKAFAIFGLPVILLFLQWLCVFATALDPKNKNQNSKVFGMVLWIMPITSLITCGIVYSLALGMDLNIDIAVRILLALMFLFMGNYMPKCRQNHTIGIKVTWTLRNEENWNKTHRFAGRLWVIGGIFLLATLMIPAENFLFTLMPVILILAIAPMIYSYVYYKKQLAAGTATNADGTATPAEKKTTAVSAAIGIVILSFAIFFIFTGKFEVQFDDTSFIIDATYWEDATVNYADISAIEYRTSDNPGSRTFGYGAPELLMGEFHNSEFGNYTRYSYTSCDSCIVLTVDGKVLVINGKDEESTRKIYDRLIESMK